MHHDTEPDREVIETDEGSIILDVVQCAGPCGDTVPIRQMVEVAIGEFVEETPEIDGDWLANVAMATPSRAEREVPPVVPVCADCASELGYVGPTGLNGTAREPTATRKIRRWETSGDVYEAGKRAMWPLVIGLWVGFWIGVNLGMWL